MRAIKKMKYLLTHQILYLKNIGIPNSRTNRVCLALNQIAMVKQSPLNVEANETKLTPRSSFHSIFFNKHFFTLFVSFSILREQLSVHSMMCR